MTLRLYKRKTACGYGRIFWDTKPPGSKVYDAATASVDRMFDSNGAVRHHHEAHTVSKSRSVLRPCRCMGVRSNKRRHFCRNLDLDFRWEVG